MDEPIELLKKELATMIFIAQSAMPMSQKKREAKKLIPKYELAIKLLEENSLGGV